MQQKYVATVAGSACVLAWQLWEAKGDFYHKYSLLQILRTVGAYICTVVLTLLFSYLLLRLFACYLFAAV